MTEDQWLSGDEPELMVEFLGERASDRQLQLYGCACLRNVWHLLVDERLRRAAQTAERLADEGKVKQRELENVRREARRAADSTSATDEAAHNAAWAAYGLCTRLPFSRLWGGRGLPIGFRHLARMPDQRRTRAEVLRDIIGDPFRPAAIDRAWTTQVAVVIAKGAYDGRAFDELPILADALEDAGCADAAILVHLRSGGLHCRGCWAIDRILGRS